MSAHMVTGLFGSRGDAECGFNAAVQHGVDAAEINVIMSDDTRARWFAVEPVTDTGLGDRVTAIAGSPAGGGALGGPVGGTIGTLAPIVAAVGVAALLPGIGLVVAGPVAAAIAAAGAVAVAGGLLGAMADWGIPRERVEEYEAEIRRGGILLGLKPRTNDDPAELAQAWRRCGATHVHP